MALILTNARITDTRYARKSGNDGSLEPLMECAMKRRGKYYLEVNKTIHDRPAFHRSTPTNVDTLMATKGTDTRTRGARILGMRSFNASGIEQHLITGSRQSLKYAALVSMTSTQQ